MINLLILLNQQTDVGAMHIEVSLCYINFYKSYHNQDAKLSHLYEDHTDAGSVIPTPLRATSLTPDNYSSLYPPYNLVILKIYINEITELSALLRYFFHLA